MKKKTGFRHFAALVTTGSVMLAAMPLSAIRAYADSPPSDAIGSVTFDNGDRKSYFTNSKELNDYLNNSNTTYNITMMQNWLGFHLVVPANKTVNLYMDEHVIDRALTWPATYSPTSGGEVILVNTGGTLNVYGGDIDGVSGADERTHEAYVYDPDETEFHGMVKTTFEGGLITGGNNLNSAGGIRALQNAKVTLTDVTVAGCVDMASSDTQGFGGGVRLDSGGTTLNMVRSSITGCYAYGNGGGLYVDKGGNAEIKLNDSYIEGNTARLDGGGIDTGSGENVVISGFGSSAVRNNNAQNGGGIITGQRNVAVSDLTVNGNHASLNGGGIYVANDGTMLSDLTIQGNSAVPNEGHGGDGYGGGVYVTASCSDGSYRDSDDSQYKDLNVTGNSAVFGGGIYFDDYTNQNKNRKRYIKGSTVVKDNTVSGYQSGKDMSIRTDDWKYRREAFALTDGAEVCVAFEAKSGSSLSEEVKQSRVIDTSCAKYLVDNSQTTQDNTVYWFNMDTRQIEIMTREEAEKMRNVVELSSEEINNPMSKTASDTSSTRAVGKIGTVSAGGDEPTGDNAKDYDLVRGFFIHDDETNVSSYYWSDGLFYDDPRNYNEHLATLSWVLAYAGGYLNQDKEKDANGNVSYNKHAGARQFLADIGCSDQDIYINNGMYIKPTGETIGVTIGSKALKTADGNKTGEYLIPITVRGLGYGEEWISNVTLGSDYVMEGGEAQGFGTAANMVFGEVRDYLKSHNLEQAFHEGRVKFWVSGYSRAGATANLTAKRLIDLIAEDGNSSQVFSYTCEAAMGGTDAAEIEGNDYTAIHNMLNKVDIVPLVAPWQMGFKRYGVDHYIPGTQAGEIVTETKNSDGVTITTCHDNSPTYTRTPEYEEQREIMLSHLMAIDYNMRSEFNDYYHPRNLFVFGTGGVFKFAETYSYDTNRIEYFVEDFMRLLLFAAANSREDYVNRKIVIDGYEHCSLQTAAQDLIGVLMSDAPGVDNFKNKAGNIMDHVSLIDKVAIYYNVFRGSNWKLKTQRGTIISVFTVALEKTGALDELTPEDRKKVKAALPTIIDAACQFAWYDYDTEPGDDDAPQLSKDWAFGSDQNMMYIATFKEHASYIISCHMPQINLAWARSYDDWYADEKDGYIIHIISEAAAPSVYGDADGKPVALRTDETNTLWNDQKIIIENENVVGEAMYYDLTDKTDNKKLAVNAIYTNGIDLTLGGVNSRNFELKTYDISYGSKSAAETYDIVLTKPGTVIVSDLDAETGSRRTSGYHFTEGENAFFNADVPKGKFFKGWEVEAFAPDDEITDSSLGKPYTISNFDTASQNASFRMPVSEEAGLEKGYQLLFTAQYGNTADNVNVSAESLLTSGGYLPTTVNVSLNNGCSVNAPVTWTYRKDGEDVPTSGMICEKTTYTAHITLAKNTAENIVFDENVNVSLTGEYAESISLDNVTRSTTDGSVSFSLVYPVTNDSHGEYVRPNQVVYVAVSSIDLNKTGSQTDSDLPIQNYRPTKEQNADGQSVITLTAAEIEGMQFVGWDCTDSALTLSDNTAKTSRTVSLIVNESLANSENDPVSVKALYKPVIESVKVTLTDENNNSVVPVGGEKIPDSKAVVRVKISNLYEVHPDDVQISWSPSPADGQFGFLTNYMAFVRINPKNTYARVKMVEDAAGNKVANAPYQEVKLDFFVSDNMTAEYNGNTENVTYDAEQKTLIKLFPQTFYRLDSVQQPENTVHLPYGATEDEIRSSLPENTSVMTDNGLTVSADINWNKLEMTDGADDIYSAKTWTATGTVVLPEGIVNTENISLEVSATASVDAAESAAAPTIDINAVGYFGNQSVSMSTETDGAVIYYTTDGSDPMTSKTRKQYKTGSPVILTKENALEELDENGNPNGGKYFTVSAYAVAEGMPASIVTSSSATLETAEAPEETTDEHLIGYTVSLDGDIGVNFYMSLSDETAQSTTAKMIFRIPSGNETRKQEIPVSDAVKQTLNGKMYYVFKCNVSAKDMASEITAQIKDGDREGTLYTYSVREYADYLLAHAEDSTEYAEAVPLIKAMLNYGAYSQKYFGTTENGLANASLSDKDKDISDVSAETISKPYDRTKEKLPKGAAFTGATLSLKSETTLSLYFTGLPADTTFTCTGNKTVETVTTDSCTIARIRGIRADELATDFTVTFKGGSVTYNPMCYCYNVLNGGSDDTSLKNTVKALYKYYAEAARYYPVS